MSGQKNVNMFRKNHFGVWTAVWVFLFLLAADAFLIWQEKNHYRENMNVLLWMTESEGSIDAAADILKGKRMEEREDSVLASYGYFLDGENYFQKEYRNHSKRILLISFLGYFIFLWIFILERKRERQRQEKVFEELAEIIGRFRKGEYDFPVEKSGLELTSILMELEAMGKTMALWQEKSRKEKEGVKSLVTDISHQLKTPIAALKATLEILEQMDLTEEEREEFLGRCQNQVRGLEILFSSLIAISRMESGMIEIRQENTSIFDTIVDAVNRVYVKAEEKEITISLEAEEEMKDLRIPHDKKWLCEAFINILENAVKYSPNGKNITIRMEKGIHFLQIKFEDEGLGISKAEYHKIFQRFYRGQSREVRSQEGSGIGLYLTREIISRHQGTITAYAGKGGNGSIFVVQIPC